VTRIKEHFVSFYFLLAGKSQQSTHRAPASKPPISFVRSRDELRLIRRLPRSRWWGGAFMRIPKA
jgi:hypothetical protein